MALEVIGASFSRTATVSLKFAREHRGFGPYHHFSEVFAGVPRVAREYIDRLTALAFAG